MSAERDKLHKTFKKVSGTIDERLSSALAKISLAARHQLRRKATEEKLSVIQAQILIHLSKEGPMEVGFLATRLALTSATVSDSIAALERRKLVLRKAISKDKRRISVEATVKGRQLGTSLALWPDLFHKGISQLCGREKEVFYRVLTRMILSLLEQGVIQEARMCVTCAHFRPNVRSDSSRPHYCSLVGVPLSTTALRVDCLDHETGMAPVSAMKNLDLWLGETV